MKRKDKWNQLEPKASMITRKLREAGFEAYFVGGCVRDRLLKLPVVDIDIATSAKPEDVKRLFQKTIPVGEQFGVVIVLINKVPFEVATFREDGDYQDGRHPESVTFSTAEEDARRRDFTVNGLYWDPEKKEVIDFVDGQSDLQKKVIRAIGDPEKRFEEDKLRLLRAARFAARFEMTIEKKTKQAIQKLSSKINEVSPERIREELVKMLTDQNPHQALVLLDELGLLKEILPEVEAMKGVEQPPEFHPEGDVFVHTMLLIKQLEYPDITLALSCLLHDIGKPKTQMKTDRIRFHQHEHVGAKMTEEIMKRLRFSNSDIQNVMTCVKRHMMYGQATQMREGKLKRLMSEEIFPTELELHRIDCTASHGDLKNYNYIKEKQAQFEKEGLKPDPFLTGDDLIKAGLKPGPEFKDLLEEAFLLQLEGKLETKKMALDWLEKNK